MRKKLRKLKGKRQTFVATVERFGHKPAYRGPDVPTLLLVDVCTIGGEKICNHLWMTAGKWSSELKPGDTFKFDARVASYIKGYRGYRNDVFDAPISKDYKLQRPTKVALIATNLAE